MSEQEKMLDALLRWSGTKKRTIIHDEMGAMPRTQQDYDRMKAEIEKARLTTPENKQPLTFKKPKRRK